MAVSESAVEATAGAAPGAAPAPALAAPGARRFRTLRRLLAHRSGVLGLAGLLLVGLRGPGRAPPDAPTTRPR